MERLAYQSLEIFIPSTDYKLFYSLTLIKTPANHASSYVMAGKEKKKRKE